MEVFNAIQTLLAVRDYQRKPIDDALVTKIVEAGRLSGSAMNKQPWNFVVVRAPETIQQLAKLATTGPYLINAPLVIVVVVPDERFGYIDGARAIQNMMLAAWGEGIGSNWVGPVNTPEVKSLFNIPQERVVLAVVPFGYPMKKLGVGRKQRKALGEVAYVEKFGQPYSG